MIIWGNRGYLNHLGYFIHECPACNSFVPFSVYKVGKKFTVYFIPTFSYSERYVIECGMCKVQFEVPNETKDILRKSLLSQEELSQMIRELGDEKEAMSLEGSEANHSSSSTKSCPYCAEQIQAAAIYCRFCNHDL